MQNSLYPLHLLNHKNNISVWQWYLQFYCIAWSIRPELHQINETIYEELAILL